MITHDAMTEHELATERLNRLHQQVSSAKAMLDVTMRPIDDRYRMPWEKDVLRIGDFLIVDMSKERWE